MLSWFPVMPDERLITVKFTAKGHRQKDCAVFRRQLPGTADRWGRCRFVFDPDTPEYDWLVAYDDLAPCGQERFSSRIERLSCPPEQTLFVTMEPSSIKTYGYDFLNQFGVVITSQEDWAVTNPQAVHTQPALRWFYGASSRGMRSWDQMVQSPPDNKTGQLSAVCSTKRQTNTVHGDRYAFVMQLREQIPGMELFGRGIRPIDDKADALDAFRYHIVIENHIAVHHWTEKLADAFLGLTLPFYYGCPNAAEYFPRESMIQIDIQDPDSAIATMREAMATGQYERRLPAIREARRRVLNEHNLFAVIAREIETRSNGIDPMGRGDTGPALLFSRHASRRRSLLHTIRFTAEHLRRKLQLRRRRQAKRAA
jgi:hypothetical protein